MSNKTRVLNHLRKEGSISPMEALIVHRIVRLAPRIHELRKLGWPIDSETRVDAAGVKYTAYVMR